MGLAEAYCRDIREQLEYYATWLPSVHVRLGDYGILDDGIFTKQGNIREFAVKFKAELGNPISEPLEYKSEGTSVSDIGAGIGGLINVGLKFNFAKKFGIYFLAAECEQSLMLGQIEVLQRLTEVFKAKKIRGDFFVATEVIKAGAFTLIASKGTNSEFVIEAKNNKLPNVDLTIPNFGFDTKKSSNVGFNIVAKSELTPLFQLKEIDN